MLKILFCIVGIIVCWFICGITFGKALCLKSQEVSENDSETVNRVSDRLRGIGIKNSLASMCRKWTAHDYICYGAWGPILIVLAGIGAVLGYIWAYMDYRK